MSSLRIGCNVSKIAGSIEALVCYPSTRAIHQSPLWIPNVLSRYQGEPAGGQVLRVPRLYERPFPPPEVSNAGNIPKSGIQRGDWWIALVDV
ncbi:unnamed protein product [Nezara viridula]|uniref:Uncharacterized protein n=1 Tax=Nezara viridula TaxID=85310 RepID=A0A9P0MMC9_NEZVI|nr:unnamed protein product [Nezara viridula]